jgi:hypothetical protein
MRQVANPVEEWRQVCAVPQTTEQEAISEGRLERWRQRASSVTSRLVRVDARTLRKRLMLLSLVPAGFSLGYLFYLGCAAGFAVCKVCGGTESGLQGRVRSIIIPIRSHELHLHHWLLSAVATTTSAIHGFSLVTPGLFYGVLGGLMLQGILCYNDWHRIVKRRVFHTQPELIG